MIRDKKFKLIKGGAGSEVNINGVIMDVIPDSISPLPVEVRVFEEDTHLVLTVDPVMRYTEEHPIRLMTRVMEMKPHKPGTVARKHSSWYAVVHDLDADPVCREEWIGSAYREILRLTEKRGVVRLGMPLLGTVHGTLPARDSLRLLLHHLALQHYAILKKILLLAKPGQAKELRSMLAGIRP